MNWETVKSKLFQFSENIPVEVALILGQCIFVIFLALLILLAKLLA